MSRDPATLRRNMRANLRAVLPEIAARAWRAEAERKALLKKGLRPDLIGFALVAVGLGSLEFVLDEGQRKDWFGSTMIVTFAIKYQKDAGVGTVIALMLPYVLVISVIWTAFLAGWHLLALPWGL